MTITNGYCTLDELKSRLDTSLIDTDDAILEQIISAVSRWIDDFTRRRFYAVSETRYYSPEFNDWLPVDDILSVSGSSVSSLKTDKDGDRTYEVAWADTDYDMRPYNAEAKGVPYSHIEITPNGDNTFPVGRKTVEITAHFGYSATTPAAIKEACLIQCARIYKRKDSPFGVAGTTEMGEMRMLTKVDVDVQAMLTPFKRMII